MERQRWIFSGLVAGVITVLSLIPVPEVKELEDVPFFDKWVHFIMYGGLTFAMWFDWWKFFGRWTMPSIRVITCTFIIPTLWGGLMELAQNYLTTCRSGEWLDFYADTFGAFLATIISYSLWKIVKTSDQK